MRHGETEWNRIGRVQGLSDIPLNETGREQARHAGRRLAAEHCDAVATSPLSRAADTAAIVAAEIGLPEPEVVPALVERNYGEAEGLTGAEIDARFGGVVQARESREQVVDRVRPALLALAERHPDGRVLVVSHGGVIGSTSRVQNMQTEASTGMKLLQWSHSRLPWAPAASRPVAFRIACTSSMIVSARRRNEISTVRKCP